MIDPGPQYVVTPFQDRFAITDRNTDQFVRGRAQPDGKSKFIWKTDKLEVAAQCCAALNQREKKPLLADKGTGPDLPVKDVDPYVMASAGKKTKKADRPTFVKCDTCGHFVRGDHNCVSS
jgi:hypothetical protein